MNSQEWLAYFRQNKQDRRLIAWHEGVRVSPDVYVPLAKSLACFQRGESSDGRRLKEAARKLAERTGDYAYNEAIQFFIGEEQEHSRLLANILQRMDAPLLRRHWSDGLFRLCRHAVGFYGEISVLLMAEIVALKYYSAVRAGAKDSVIASVCDQILYDEKFHVRFHCEYLHRVIARKSSFMQTLCWRSLTTMFAGASAVVAVDHRRTFDALDGSAREFLRDSWRNFAAARHSIFTGEPFEWSLATESAVIGEAKPGASSELPRSISSRAAGAWARVSQALAKRLFSNYSG